MKHLIEVFRWVGRNGKRIAVSVIGFTLLAAGLVGFVFPIIPGIPLLIAGLAVLGTEYAWARRALAQAKDKAKSARSKAGRLFRRKRSS